LPGSSFETPRVASLDGILLADPMGEWPASRTSVEGSPEFSGNATNGARWLDSDRDTFIGSTGYAVGPGGVSAEGDGPRPYHSYGATSPSCPRTDPAAARSAYVYPPSLDGAVVRRIKRVFTATRTISALRGTIDSCDQLSGQLVGQNPDGGIRINALIGGCVRVEDPDAEAGCSPAVLDFLQGAGTARELPPGKFVMRRVSDTITCEQVRAMVF
jgi:hypothetical protein